MATAERTNVSTDSAADFLHGTPAKMSASRKPDYTNALALAPMVRCGTLPLRLLALRHGADLLWSEELIAWKMSKCIRRVDDASGFVYFCNPPRSANGAPDQDAPVYITCPEEKGRNILQLGAADGPSAVAAGLVVADDVAGLDVNMGCPKPFSLQGGMGSALLKDIERASDIVKSLDRNFGADIGVTCKIRLLPTMHETIHFVNAMILSGAQAVTVHTRLVGERPVDFAHWDALGSLVESVPAHIPIIANGDVFNKADVDALRSGSKVSSVMVARGALANCSMFGSCKSGLPLQHPFELISEYLAISGEVGNRYPNTKYTVQSMVKEAGYVSEEAMFRTKSMEELESWCLAWCRRARSDGMHRSQRLRSARTAGVAAPFIESASARVSDITVGEEDVADERQATIRKEDTKPSKRPRRDEGEPAHT